MPPTLLRRSARGAAIASLAALAACDLPSAAPIFQQTWIVPVDSVTVGVADLVPDGVTLVAGTPPTLQVSTPSANISTTLADLCGEPECRTPFTVRAPTPAFRSPDGLLAARIDFPTGVTSVTVIGGTFNLDITNNLGFDPLRPKGATGPYGIIIMSLTSGTATRTDTISGATQSIANGAMTNLSLPLPTGVYSSRLDVAIAFDVPAGDSATMNGSNGLGIAVSLQLLSLSQLTVEVVNEPVATGPTGFDLDGVDFGDQVENGALLLTVDNPLTATAALNVVLDVPAQNGFGPVTISKAINVPAQPTSTATVLLSKAEIQSLLGKTGVTIRATGVVNGTGVGSTVSVTPTSRITVHSQLRLTLNVGA